MMVVFSGYIYSYISPLGRFEEDLQDGVVVGADSWLLRYIHRYMCIDIIPILPKNVNEIVNECAFKAPVTEQWEKSFVRKDVLACEQGVKPPAICMNLFRAFASGRYCGATLNTIVSHTSF